MKLCISVDCGSSLTKVLYRLWKGSKESVDGYFTMKPLIEEMLAERIEEYKKHFEFSEVLDPLQQAYLTVGKRSFVLGDFAEALHVEEMQLDKKYEYALYRTHLGSLEERKFS